MSTAAAKSCCRGGTGASTRVACVSTRPSAAAAGAWVAGGASATCQRLPRAHVRVAVQRGRSLAAGPFRGLCACRPVQARDVTRRVTRRLRLLPRTCHHQTNANTPTQTTWSSTPLVYPRVSRVRPRGAYAHSSHQNREQHPTRSTASCIRACDTGRSVGGGAGGRLRLKLAELGEHADDAAGAGAWWHGGKGVSAGRGEDSTMCRVVLYT